MNDIPEIFRKQATPSNQTADLQRRADNVIDSLRPQYIAQTRVGVTKLADWVAILPTMSPTEQLTLITGEFFRAAHDIKGQGTTFGFPLMTELGTHICQRIKAGAPFTETDIQNFATDIADMKTVLDKELIDDGGVTGEQIRIRIGDI